MEEAAGNNVAREGGGVLSAVVVTEIDGVDGTGRTVDCGKVEREGIEDKGGGTAEGKGGDGVGGKTEGPRHGNGEGGGKEEVEEKLPIHLALTPEELAARGRAPVKKEFLKMGGRRSWKTSDADGKIGESGEAAAVSEEGKGNEGSGGGPVGEKREREGEWEGKGGARVQTEKLSKRQRLKELKKARREQVCNNVSRSGDPSTCPFGSNCRFSHDVTVFLQQRLPDLPGSCPFTKGCPYGLMCRFASSHALAAAASASSTAEAANSSASAEAVASSGAEAAAAQAAAAAPVAGRLVELSDADVVDIRGESNELKKELQQQLWKRTVKTDRADAALKAIGWQRKVKLKGEAALMADDDDDGGDGNDNINVADTRNGVADGETDQHKDDEDMVIVADAEDVSRQGKQQQKQQQRQKQQQEQVDGEKREEKDEEKEQKKAQGSEVEGKLREEEGKSVSNEEGKEPVTEDDSKEAAGVTDCVPLASEGKVEAANGEKAAEEGRVGDDKELHLPVREKKKISFKGKMVLAPLTTVGNLPFRRVCKEFGADVTVGEMAMCANLLQGQASEWALLRRHESEDCFGVQICGPHPDMIARTADIIADNCNVDFIDINVGCPIDIVTNKGCGSAMLCKPHRLEQCVRATAQAIDVPLTVKMRMAFYEGQNCAHKFIPKLANWGAAAVTVHGRSRQQRYSKYADWDYINACAAVKPPNLQMIGNGDIFSYTDWNKAMSADDDQLHVDACMLARGALIKPWLPTEIREQRHWDISAGERFDILKKYTAYGLTHWGSDSRGVETTRKFLLEWLSYLHRYIPVGLLDIVPQRLNWRPPAYFARNDLETLMASDQAADWLRISEMLLGPTPPGFVFVPKHKSNAYDKAENG